jgi:hypothetical protein
MVKYKLEDIVVENVEQVLVHKFVTIGKELFVEKIDQTVFPKQREIIEGTKHFIVSIGEDSPFSYQKNPTDKVLATFDTQEGLEEWLKENVEVEVVEPGELRVGLVVLDTQTKERFVITAINEKTVFADNLNDPDSGYAGPADSLRAILLSELATQAEIEAMVHWFIKKKDVLNEPLTDEEDMFLITNLY